MSRTPFYHAAAIALSVLAAGCAPVAITALGVGSATAVNHTLTGIAYKTFTIPMPRVKSASLTALNRMGMKVAGTSRQDGNDVITATGNERNIEVLLEPISSKSTRMRVTARTGGLLYDSATATEIIIQTDKVLTGT
jgi:uncharacterized protein DUF3568